MAVCHIMNKNYLTLTVIDVECYKRAKVSMDRGAGTSKRQWGRAAFSKVTFNTNAVALREILKEGGIIELNEKQERM